MPPFGQFLRTATTVRPLSERIQAALRRRTLLGYAVASLALVAAFSLCFHAIMVAEGRSYSWLTGPYWVLTTMTTIGFGDITFQGDLGKVFSIVVMLIGVLVFQVLLTFFVIQYL
jgi:voltage-gated potassium channel